MPNGIALIVTLHGSNYRCLEQIFMVLKGFEPSKFDCITFNNQNTESIDWGRGGGGGGGKQDYHER